MSIEQALPESSFEFELDDNRNYSHTFWNSFFRKRKRKFEWFCQYSDISCLFDELFDPKTASVLHVGCGNSSFPRDMIEHGWSNITAIDFSTEVIKQMIEIGPATPIANGALTYQQMDAMRLIDHFGQNSFDFVTEKGVLDDLVRDTNADTRAKCIQMVSQTLGVLRPTGKFVIISMCRPHMLEFLGEAILEGFGGTRASRVSFYPILASEQAMSIVFPYVIVIEAPTLNESSLNDDIAVATTVSGDLDTADVTHVNGHSSRAGEFFAEEVAVHTMPVIDGNISEANAHKEHMIVTSMEDLLVTLAAVSKKMQSFRFNLVSTQSSPSSSISPLNSPIKSKKVVGSIENEESEVQEVVEYKKDFKLEITLSAADFDPEEYWNEIQKRHVAGGWIEVAELIDYRVIPIGFGIDLFRVEGLATFEIDASDTNDIHESGKLKYDSFLRGYVDMISSWESVQSCSQMI